MKKGKRFLSLLMAFIMSLGVFSYDQCFRGNAGNGNLSPGDAPRIGQF